MVFTVNPAEAQGIQEDEAQLLAAIAQAAKGTLSSFSRTQQPDTPKSDISQSETMRIQMGRRVVYGQMANGQFRNELSADRLKTIFDALQRPIAEGVNPNQYKGKIPAIEIQEGDNVLFREERDGTVTVNAVQFQLQGQTQTNIGEPVVSEEVTSSLSPQPTQELTNEQDSSVGRALQEQRDWNLEEKEEIASNQALQEDQTYWLESNPSDGDWATENIDFQKSTIQQQQQTQLTNQSAQELKDFALSVIEKQAEQTGWSDNYSKGVSIGSGNPADISQLAAYQTSGGSLKISYLDSEQYSSLRYTFGLSPKLAHEQAMVVVLATDSKGQIQTYKPEAAAYALSELKAIEGGETTQSRLEIWYQQTLQAAVDEATSFTPERINELLADTAAKASDLNGIQAQDMAEIASYLLNPLGDEQLQYQTVVIQDYQITQNDSELIVTKGEQLVLRSKEGEVLKSDGATLQDWLVFQQLQPPAQIHLSQDQNVLTPDVAQAVPAAQSDKIPAIAVAEKEADSLPEGGTKQLLQTTIQDWKQQVRQSLTEGVRQGVSWLASRPEAMRDWSIARTSLELFNQGYERTAEKSYSIGDYKISLQGRNTYTLSDAKGELMRFKASKSLIPGIDKQRIEIVEKSDRVSPALQKVMCDIQLGGATPQGDLDVEANYVAKTNRVEQTVTRFLQDKANAQVWDKEGGKFRMEVGKDNFLRITDKQEGRGVVFQRENGKVFSRLGAKDFAHFERLANRMQQAERQQHFSSQRQPVQQFRFSSRQSGLEMG